MYYFIRNSITIPEKAGCEKTKEGSIIGVEVGRYRSDSGNSKQYKLVSSYRVDPYNVGEDG